MQDYGYPTTNILSCSVGHGFVEVVYKSVSWKLCTKSCGDYIDTCIAFAEVTTNRAYSSELRIRSCRSIYRVFKALHFKTICAMTMSHGKLNYYTKTMLWIQLFGKVGT